MKTFFVDLLSRLNIFSAAEKPFDRIINSHWVSLSDIASLKRVFIFRTSNVLLVAENGQVKRCTWDYLSDKSLIIDIAGKSYLLKIDFIDDTIIALKIDGQDGHAFFINETLYGTEINSVTDVIRYLKVRYLPKLMAHEIQPVLDKLVFHMKNVKSNIFFTDERECECIVQIIKSNVDSVESALNFMQFYHQKFGTDLIDDLYNLSTFKKHIKYLLQPFIELNFVEPEFPHQQID